MSRLKFLFPATFMANTFAMTGVMIVLSLGGKSELAADFGIVHGATLALFFAFSANARSLILNASSTISVSAILGARALLLVPLGALSLLLSTHLASVDALLAFVLVLRRGVEWIAEVHVSDMEMRGDSRSAVRFLSWQAILTATVLLWLLVELPLPEVALGVWATSPLWIGRGHIRLRGDVETRLRETWSRLLPHFGSTSVTGISVYVFRLLILLLVGKSVAGDLYAAFAMGGLFGSMFAQAIGPTVVLQESRDGHTMRSAWLKAIKWLSLVLGAAVCGVAAAEPKLLTWTGKPVLFWLATGLSLIGSAVMITAWQYRLRILQQHADRDVFGPDVLINILLVASVPYLFFLFGVNALTPLYLISSVLAIAFYFSAAKAADFGAGSIQPWAALINGLIALLILFPLFFQLTGTVFRDPAYVFETDGLLRRLPVPVSVLAFGGIVLLGRYHRAYASLATIFFTFTLMLMSSGLLNQGDVGQQQAKLILAIQLVLPMFALVLGQMYEDEKGSSLVCAKIFLWVLALVVPAQLVATWLRGHPLLSPYLYAFSVYQHLQYVPIIFVAAYLFALYSLWQIHSYRRALAALAMPMGLFAAASLSVLALGALSAGVMGFALRERTAGRRDWRTWTLLAMVVLSAAAYRPIVMSSGLFTSGGLFTNGGPLSSSELTAPLNVLERLHYWSFYAQGVLSDFQSAVLGHLTPPDRKYYPSAHNYYLDFAYNFGLIALLPMLGLIGLTLVKAYQHRRTILRSPDLLGLTVIVLFLVLVDNSLKVGMRQPYPGIFTFFLWGLLLSRLKFQPADTNREPINRLA